jgi:Zn-dependent metalloprotease
VAEAVIGNTLVSNGESGAIRQHLVDVFATLVEQWYKKQSVEVATWLIGQGILGPKSTGLALRSLKAPGTAYDDLRLGKDPQPSHMRNYVNTNDDNGGVHTNCGIPNRAFYETASRMNAPAWERAGKIWYESLLKLSEHTTFAEFAATTYSVAGELFGDSSQERSAVESGWQAVGITVGPSR